MAHKSFNIFDPQEYDKVQNIFQAISHSSIIAVTDSIGDITYVNDKFCQISKYSLEELIGQNHRILKSGHHPERFFNEIWSTITSGKTWSGEIKNRAKDGSYYWVFNTIAPILNSSSVDGQYVSIQFDITEKKTFEDKMNKLKLDLDQAMIEREIREQFLSTLSHDLKTPLTIAKISAQMIEKKYTLTDKIKSLSTKITDNINRVDSLITNLLNANTCRNFHNLPQEFTELDMRDVVYETIENFTTIHGNRFILDTSGNFKGYWCLSSIKRILDNLIANAIKYGDPETPILIQLKENNNQLTLAIHNKGNPISEKDQGIIFDYLQRSSTAESSGEKGWGLGLTIVKGMAEVHGGSVSVASYPDDKGTTFSVNLPKDSRIFAQERAQKSSNLILATESENFLRLFRHMPEILFISSGPFHKFEFVNDAYVEAFGANDTGKTISEIQTENHDHLQILDEVYHTGIPHRVMERSLYVSDKIRTFDQSWVPRKNNSGVIIGVLSISYEVR